jgi:hypothetical protein
MRPRVLRHLPFLALSMHVGACSNGDTPAGAIRQALDASVDGSIKDAAMTPEVSADDAGDAHVPEGPEPSWDLLPPTTPGATMDFLTTNPPSLVLTEIAMFDRHDLLDKSVDPPEPHHALVSSDLEFFPDASGDALLVLSTGLIVWLDRNMQVKGTFPVDSSNSFAKYSDRDWKFLDNEGVLGLAFDPHFSDNGFFYLHVTPDAYMGVEIWRLQWKPNQLQRLWESGVRLLKVEKPQIAEIQEYLQSHNGGNLTFGPDGMLYVAIGDGGIYGGMQEFWTENPAQSLDNYWGKIVRVDPQGLLDPEIVAYGVRNPFTNVWRGNELYFGDVGQEAYFAWEEINRLVVTPGASLEPANYAHPLALGPCEAMPESWPYTPDCSTVVEPVHGYRRDDSTFLSEVPGAIVPEPGTMNRQAVILGPAYPGGGYDGYLDNVVLYADLLQGWVRGALFDANGSLVKDRHLAHHDGWKLAFSVSPDRHVYMVGGCCAEFSIYRLDVAPTP